MTNRNKTTLAGASGAARVLTLSALALSLAGCSIFGSGKVDYRDAKKAAPLEVPPDLTQLQKDNRYAVPDARGVATASGYQQARGAALGAAPMAASAEPIGPVQTEEVRIERAGDQRWLVVKRTPEQLWPQLRQFWEDAGFEIVSASPETGTMETNWVEDRSKIPEDFLRRTLGKVIDRAYSTGERDKFRTRLERLPDGSTEIYISHRGAEEVLTGAQKESTAWTVRANDPGLEAQYLSRLLAKLTGAADVKAVQATVDKAAPAPLHARLVGDKVELDEGFDRAWRRVGLALDRVGFTVEDRDRVQGIYFVRFVDPEAGNQEGFIKRLFSFGNDDKAKEAQRYRVLVKAAPNGGTSEVTVQGKDGQPENSPTGAKILKLLNDELK